MSNFYGEYTLMVKVEEDSNHFRSFVYLSFPQIRIIKVKIVWRYSILYISKQYNVFEYFV